MSRYLRHEIESLPNVSVRMGAQIVDAEGKDRCERVLLQDDGGAEWISASGVFVFIGARPRTEWLPPEIERDERGYVLTDESIASNWPFERAPFLLETSSPGVFAAGDVRSGSVKRVAAAVGEGAAAIQQVHRYLATREPDAVLAER
jgi:thioredoxin reductase (NADPH)